eukprot:CAMPEP_0204501750 /NCGR_PEP_ID=MMETSP0471-20130131/99860_1 /ASSEMBLY_ACC=CAM_ASM_000602 /TAXON_ID=2969 /ORGANISM="Oxyrrhis marina" /LENGTH=119 /DNA_ID=CAMNT_0051506443 /DNA_START=258 /DNA_END=618 /DNA_ORIENTATION=-
MALGEHVRRPPPASAAQLQTPLPNTAPAPRSRWQPALAYSSLTDADVLVGPGGRKLPAPDDHVLDQGWRCISFRGELCNTPVAVQPRYCGEAIPRQGRGKLSRHQAIQVRRGAGHNHLH